MTELQLRRDMIPDADIMDVKTVSLSKHFLTVYSHTKVGETENSDMVMLNIKEATELLKFLKENL